MDNERCLYQAQPNVGRLSGGVMADGYVIGQEVYNSRPTWHGKNVTMAALRRLRLAMLEHELAQARLQHNIASCVETRYNVVHGD